MRNIHLRLVQVCNGAILKVKSGATGMSRRYLNCKKVYRRTSITLMCLAIPMQIINIDGTTARARARGIERDVSLFLLQDQKLTAGEFILVHVGYAIQRISHEDALRSWSLYDEMHDANGDSVNA